MVNGNYYSHSNGNGGSYRPSYGGRSNYQSRSSFGGNGYQSAAPKKHSGARFVTKEDGAQIVSAWNYSRSKGMVVLYARPFKNTHRVESKNGKIWVNLFATIVYRKTGQIAKTGALLDVQAKRLYVKELNMIATSKGKGGYFGKQF